MFKFFIHVFSLIFFLSNIPSFSDNFNVSFFAIKLTIKALLNYSLNDLRSKAIINSVKGLSINYVTQFKALEIMSQNAGPPPLPETMMTP